MKKEKVLSPEEKCLRDCFHVTYEQIDEYMQFVQRNKQAAERVGITYLRLQRFDDLKAPDLIINREKELLEKRVQEAKDIKAEMDAWEDEHKEFINYIIFETEVTMKAKRKAEEVIKKTKQSKK